MFRSDNCFTPTEAGSKTREQGLKKRLKCFVVSDDLPGDPPGVAPLQPPSWDPVFLHVSQLFLPPTYLSKLELAAGVNQCWVTAPWQSQNSLQTQHLLTPQDMFSFLSINLCTASSRCCQRADPEVTLSLAGNSMKQTFTLKTLPFALKIWFISAKISFS